MEGFDVMLIHDGIRKINKNAESNKLRAEEIAALVKYLIKLKSKFDAIPDQEWEPLKLHCDGLQRALFYTQPQIENTGWKDLPLLRGSAVFANNILKIASIVNKGEDEVIREYGDIPTTKANVSDTFRKLIQSLIAAIKKAERKELEAKRRLAAAR